MKNNIATKKVYNLTVVVLLLLLPILTVLSILIGHWDNTVAYIVPYDFIKQFLCYDHIMYNGEHYYRVEQGSIPEEYADVFIPFSSERIYVTLVDGDGDPYDSNRKEEARTYVNDEDIIFIYFGSCPFTKDKRFAD